MGFEVVVRPAVLPNIRPAPAQSLPPEDDPEKGFAVIRGNGAKEVTLSNSYSASVSAGQQREIKRRVDVARIYQQNEDKTINRDNFVDIEVANKIWMEGGGGGGGGGDGGVDGGVEKKESWELQPVKEEDNVEIKQKDKMRKAEGGLRQAR